MTEIIKKDSSPEESNQIITPEAPDVNIDAWIATRKEFIEKVGGIMIQGADYHIIKDKKSLAKGGAEKLASIFNWQAEFVRDTESLEMLGKPAGLVAFTCNLTRNSQFIGQGRGAAMLAANNGDPNKTLKMAQKSAFIDAVIRSSGLSDIYTQDLEDMNGHEIQAKPSREATRANVHPASDAQRNLITKLKTEKGYTTQDFIDQGFDPMDTSSVAASKIIKFLLEAPAKKEELPTIDQETQDIIESTPFPS